MKVLLISPLPPLTGGIATWTTLYLESMEAKKNEIDVINSSVSGKRVENFDKKSITGEMQRTRKILNELKSHINTDKYDIVHINTSCSKLGMLRDYLCAKLSKRQKVKLIVHCHCDTSYMVKGKISEYLFRKLCGVADNIFCLNQSSNKHITQISEKNSRVIPNFFDGNQLININRIKYSECIKNVVFVGHIVKSKGCDDIIKVAKRMPNLNFKLIGFVSDEIKRLQAPNNIEFLGEISKEEVLNQMLLADLLLFPTHTEGFPNVVLEAMACGLPIISTPVGAIPDMIGDEGGILVEVGDVNGFIKAIDNLQDKELRLKMSEWNKEKVEKSYTVDKVMGRIFMEYSSLGVNNEKNFKRDIYRLFYHK